MQNLKLQIEGMSCGGCVRNVTSALQSVPGVTVNNVAVGSAEVSLDASKSSADDVKRTVEQRGFRVVQMS